MRLPAEPLTAVPTPPVVERSAWQEQLDTLLVREKAHTREGDGIAAARRRLPATQVDPSARVVGADGEVPLLDVFEGRRLLIAYVHMWHDGDPFEGQCPGCTFSTAQIQQPDYLNARDVTLAVLCEGTYEEIAPYAEFMGYRLPWYSVRGREEILQGREAGFIACYLRTDEGRILETYWTTGRGTEVLDWAYGLIDMTVYGRQEGWQDSPEGWPAITPGTQWSVGGRPVAQWSALR